MTFPNCYDPNHFYLNDNGEVVPQPWMQLRSVKRKTIPAKSGGYGSSGGGNKNELLQSVQLDWTNDTPLSALVYGEVTRDGSKVTLQARSRGGILMQHGCSLVAGAIKLTDASLLAVGLDVGRGGNLGLDTDFGITEVRQPSVTIPLCPDKTGITTVVPGATFTARVDTRFVTSIWQGTDPDGGAAGSESTYSAGDLTLELFALPVIT